MRQNVEAENRILLVEDDAPLRRSLENFLERAGYAFDSCSTAREALQLAEKVHHGVVISEYHLPDADGTGLLEKLKILVPEMVAIILSEYDFQVVADEIVRVSVGSYLKKPFDLVEMESALSSAFSKAVHVTDNIDWKQGIGGKGVPVSNFK
ncbi:MAG: response regulator [Syntrophobacteraceae bacterium]|nr:response regulator [Syntrophobacteraceae bacterium]